MLLITHSWRASVSGETIFIIDDDEAVRKTFSLALELEGYVIIEATNGQEALTILEALDVNHLPRCIILDLNMPIMDGRRFLEILSTKSHKRFSHIPVIVASAALDTRELPTRAAAILRKPTSLDMLYGTIRKTVSSNEKPERATGLSADKSRSS